MIKDNQIPKAAEIAGVHHAARGNGFDSGAFLCPDEESLPLADTVTVLTIAALNRAGYRHGHTAPELREVSGERRRRGRFRRLFNPCGGLGSRLTLLRGFLLRQRELTGAFLCCFLPGQPLLLKFLLAGVFLGRNGSVDLLNQGREALLVFLQFRNLLLLARDLPLKLLRVVLVQFLIRSKFLIALLLSRGIRGNIFCLCCGLLLLILQLNLRHLKIIGSLLMTLREVIENRVAAVDFSRCGAGYQNFPGFLLRVKILDAGIGRDVAAGILQSVRNPSGLLLMLAI